MSIGLMDTRLGARTISRDITRSSLNTFKIVSLPTIFPKSPCSRSTQQALLRAWPKSAINVSTFPLGSFFALQSWIIDPRVWQGEPCILQPRYRCRITLKSSDLSLLSVPTLHTHAVLILRLGYGLALCIVGRIFGVSVRTPRKTPLLVLHAFILTLLRQLQSLKWY